MEDRVKQEIIGNFKSRNIDVEFFDSLANVNDKIINLISKDCSIGIGNSKTLKEMNISEILINRGNVVFDKSYAKNKEETKKIKKKSLLSDWYITGTNAISKQGHIVNIGHSGNRVSAMIFGPDKVIVIIGKNKICNTLEEAIQRARNVAAPLNAKRAGYNPPCVTLNKCVDCKTDERVCFNLVIIEGQSDKQRMKLFILNEELGF